MSATPVEALAPLLAFAALGWAAGVRLRDASVADLGWGPAFVVAAWWWAARAGAFEPRAFVVLALVTLWGARLALHLASRRAGHGEDPRYAAMRARGGAHFWWSSAFTVFALQAVLAWIVAWPLWAALHPAAPRALVPLDALALALWAGGFAFEAIGDAQLAAFRSDPANRGRVMDRGLWAWTRHPNYFGDALLWWGFGVFALSTPGAAWTLVGPALMTFLLVRVSGVSLLERGMASRPGWAEYAARTSAFVPWPPRRGTAHIPGGSR
ncbi:MAG: DUF1295 domain-containing protein [Candidatus Eisenbacteria bacterium]